MKKYSCTVYGDYYVSTNYTSQDIKDIIIRYLMKEKWIAEPAFIFTLVIRDAEEYLAVVGTEEDTYYPSLCPNGEEMDKINKAIAELLLDKKIYVDYYSGGFRLWN